MLLMKAFKKSPLLFVLLFTLQLCLSCSVFQKRGMEQLINPLQFGLNNARTGEDRFNVLLRTHQEAKKRGLGVTYKGIKKIDLTLPENARSIPLTHYTDFANVTINVENNVKNIPLFYLSSKLTPVKVSGRDIDNQDFSCNSHLKTGGELLVIYDQTLWVEQRIGYDKGAERKDVVLVKNGKGCNATVQNYSTSSSNPKCFYCDVDFTKKYVIKNLKFNRTESSTEKTYLVKIENQYDVELADIIINTPDGSGLTGDRVIYFLNCSKIAIKNVIVNGTYSLLKQSGYGVYIDNVHDLYVEKMYARANWGVFGTHNVNKACLKNCDINRFDIHCYGRDVSFENCSFVDLYNQFSGIYGYIKYNKCTFTNCYPVLIEGSYNAFTPFELSFNQCSFNFDKKHTSVVYLSSFSNDDNSRPELRIKSLPNVSILNCSVNLTEGLDKWFVFDTKKAKDFKGSFSHINRVVIENLSSNTSTSQMSVFSNVVNTEKKVELKTDKNIK